MTVKTDLPISSCWVVTEGLVGLQNQAIGLAQGLGLPYVLKEVRRPKGLWQFLSPNGHDLAPPWPDLLISCGRQSVPVSVAVRRASANKTFTVHIQNPLINPEHFDLVIVPAHDKLQGRNVFVTHGAIHHVSTDKLISAASHFHGLLATLPRPIISVLIGGKTRHQTFTVSSAHDLAKKLLGAATNTGGGLAVSFSRRTDSENEAILRRVLKGCPSYVWDGTGENPYLGLLALAEAIVVTSDSISMISEASSTGKPVYIYELANVGKRHQQFCESLIRAGIARPFLGAVDTWKYTPLDETSKAANFVYERYAAKMCHCPLAGEAGSKAKQSLKKGEINMQTLAQEIPLKVKTFSNATGGSALFKALGHPLTSPKIHNLIKSLSSYTRVAVYDPLGQAAEFEALYDLSQIKITDVLVQNVMDIGKQVLGLNAKPATDFKSIDADAIFIAAFDSPRLTAQIQHLLLKGVKVFSFDDARLPDEFLTNARNYLDSLNFATNFVFFREEAGHHTRLVTANYWAGYSTKNVGLWCCLFNKDGKVLAQWNEKLEKSAHTITLDSREMSQRLGLAGFTGSLFVHFTGIAGHDVVKYALDTYGNDDSVLSCTHDANSWPADLYAGLPAPREGEQVLLWVQNSHPCAIPANGMGLSLMGSDEVVGFDKPIAGFATCAIDVTSLFPKARWPQQFEVHAGRHFVRPRYEIIDGNGRRLIAHTNVERNDLKPDPGIRNISKVMGKGFILPAPILPITRWQNIALPTPMSTCQDNLPLTLIIYNSKGLQVGFYPLGKLERGNIKDLNINNLLGKLSEKEFPGGFGHSELVYDFSQGGEADGWLHALYRYEDTKSGHNAETSFGSHIFNTALVYKNEPQSYAGRPPGLSTRLFLRLGVDEGTDTLCHLIYPASTPWHAQSETDLILMDAKGTEILKKPVRIACSGSLLWRYHEMFDKQERQRAGQDAYIIIRDTTCRLFGYHGLIKGERSFCLDHMFGF